MAQASTPPENAENTENSKTESVNLLSQALGPEVGVFVPKVELYSSQQILTEILGPLNSFKFHSLEKATCDFVDPRPTLVEVRDSSDGALFRFMGRKTVGIFYAGRYTGGYIFTTVLVDSQKRDLLYANCIRCGDLDYKLSCVEGANKQSVGKVIVPGSFSCDARYQVTATNLATNQPSGPLMEVRGTSSNRNCCCCTSDTLLFTCPDPNNNSDRGNLSGPSDPRVVGELKRIPNSVSKNPNGTSQVTFDQKLPIAHKIWILFICYHHHYRNFASAACSRNGQRGLVCNCLNICIGTVGILILTALLLIVFLVILK